MVFRRAADHHGYLRISVAIPVAVQVPDQRVRGVCTIHGTAAVIVLPVAHLLRAWMDVVVIVIAVRGVGGVVRRDLAANRWRWELPAARSLSIARSRFAVVTRVPSGNRTIAVFPVVVAASSRRFLISRFAASPLTPRRRKRLGIRFPAMSRQGSVRSSLLST